MKEEFDVNLTAQDMFRFNIYHTYHSFRGVILVALPVLLLALTVLSWGKMGTVTSMVYIGLCLVLVAYVPVSLWLNANAQFKRTQALQNTQHFAIDDTGVTISQEGEEATLAWAQIYKVVETGSSLLVYSTRINAYVFPIRDLGEKKEAVARIMQEHLESYRLKLKA